MDLHGQEVAGGEVTNQTSLRLWPRKLGLSKAGILELAIRGVDASRNPPGSPAAPEAVKEAG